MIFAVFMVDLGLVNFDFLGHECHAKASVADDSN